jgi:helicase
VVDKKRRINSAYGPFGIRTAEPTSETDDITPLLRGKCDIALLTFHFAPTGRD